jgi:sugar transferase (PEP-CTERM/EpsH1 system associated)
VKLDSRRARAMSATALLMNRPLRLDYYRSRSLSEWVARLHRKLPVSRVLVFSSVMAQFVEPQRYARKVIDFVDVDSAKWSQYAVQKSWPMNRVYAREGRQLLRYERRVAREFDASLFVSAQEAALFSGLASESAARIGWFSNGVDSSYFSPMHDFDNPFPEGGPVMVFTGAMDYWPNVDAVQWFADDILPAILQRHPKARFYIVGARPSPQVQALGQRPGIHVTGTVPDVRPYLAHAQISVAPLRIARGIQNKVLEAMAMALPVVLTGNAATGIDAIDGEHFAIGDSDAALVTAALDLLGDRRAADKLGMEARRFVTENASWQSALAKLPHLLALSRGTVRHAA